MPRRYIYTAAAYDWRGHDDGLDGLTVEALDRLVRRIESEDILRLVGAAADADEEE